MFFLITTSGTVWFSVLTDRFLFTCGLKRFDGFSYRTSLTSTRREPRWKVVHFEECDRPYHENSTLHWDDGSFELEVLENDRVTHKDHFQDVRLVRVRESGSQPYSPGDYALVRAANRREHVDQLLSLLPSIPVNVSFTLTATNVAFPVPAPMRRLATLRHCATLYWDLTAIPKRSVLELLLQFTDLESERAGLQNLSTQENFEKGCVKLHKTILELLAEFPSATANLPLSYLFEVFQPIRLRAYSIASSPTVHLGELHILVAVVEYNTSASRPRQGLCSHWLASRRVGDRIQIAVRPGAFKFPENSSVPLLMVGPGTGVAPFRSLALTRASHGTARSSLLLLAFGCRSGACRGDFYLRNDWETLSRNGQLTLLTAFSRDQPHKVYVQDVLEGEASLVGGWLRRGGRVFVCGRAEGMPAGVRRALVTVVQTTANCTAEQAERFITQMEATGAYQTVVWS